MRNWTSRLLALSAGLLLLAGTAPAWADSVDVSLSFSCLGSGCSQSAVHEEGTGYQDYDFKGWVYLTASNGGSEAWGDYHFQLFSSPPSYEDITNLVFQTGGGFGPQSSQSISSVSLSGDGKTLDVYFDGDPVAPTDTLHINVYTNNADHISYFGVLSYPTPIPEPGTAALMGLSLLGLLAMVRRTARR